MRFIVRMRAGVSGPGEHQTDSAQEALTQFEARLRQFGSAQVLDGDGGEISLARLRDLADEEARADRQQWHARNA